MSRGWNSGSLDASGESRDFHVGGSEEVLWGWEGTEVLGLRGSVGIGLLGRGVVTLAVGSGRCGGNWVMECFPT